MKKLISFGVLLIYVINAFAQQVTINSLVIDEQTKAPLMYATIYIGTDHGTISNQEGEFSITALPTDMLRISYVGYETRNIKASNAPATISLRPLVVNLSEIVVKPIDIHEFLMRVHDKYKKDNDTFGKVTNSFFYRQITQTNSVCNEILEAFLNAKPHLSILNIELITGRYANLPSDSVHKYMHFKNFFYQSQLRPVVLSKKIKIKNDTYIQPLFKDYDKYYTVDYDILYNPNDASTIYKISFKPRKGIMNPIIKGDAFIDSSTLELKRFEGDVLNNIVTLTNYETDEKKRLDDAKTHFEINYKTMGGASFVESVIVDMHYFVQKSGRMDIHSIMYNVGTGMRDNTKKLHRKSNLLEEVASQEYNPSFWKETAIIKRTPLEKSVTEMFEKKDLFGTYSLKR